MSLVGGRFANVSAESMNSLKRRRLRHSPNLSEMRLRLKEEKDGKNASKNPSGKNSATNVAEKTVQNQSINGAEARKLSYAEQREHEKLVRKARKKVEEAEVEVARLEQEVADIETIISAGNPPADIYDRHASATKQLENAMSLWELASLELDDISGQK